jgi:hypothetical protein
MNDPWDTAQNNDLSATDDTGQKDDNDGLAVNGE